MKNEPARDCTYNYCYSALLHSVTRMWMTRQIFITNCLLSIQRLSTKVSNMPCHCLVEIFMLWSQSQNKFSFSENNVNSVKTSVMHLKSPWHCIPDMGSGRDDGSALCLSGGQTTNHTSMNLVGPSWMAFLGLGIIYKAVSGPREGNLRNPSTAFVHKMQVIHVLWPMTYWVPLKSGSIFLCRSPAWNTRGKTRWNPEA